jgi:hypothetical protein
MREIFLLLCNINNDANAANTTTYDNNNNNNNNNNNSIELLEHLSSLKLVKKFLEFMENDVFIVVLTSTHFFSLFCARLIQSMAYHSTFLLPYNNNNDLHA